ncbi:MAG: efflux RND transporter periplasmic adaptor subunit [Planctomycetes bacterium]|nr:efflux RND transporter periplasmic adaptor subunit [Planctomycetota bacterium]
MRLSWFLTPTLVIVSAWASMFAGACKKEESRPPAAAPAPAGGVLHAVGPESSPVPPTLDKGWCSGHGVPESVCTRCDASLIPKFKAANDWCGEHALPETQCTICNPDVKAKWEALRPKEPGTTVPQPASPEEAPPKEGAGPGRGADAGTRDGGAPAPLGADARALFTGNDPACNVDRNQVRFLDRTILEKAGIKVEPVERRRVSATLECPGELDFDQTRLARVTPRVQGVIREARADLGQTVHAGEVLAILESPTLAEAKSRYIEARERYLLATADHERAEAVFRGTQHILASCEQTDSTQEMRERFASVKIGDAKSRLLKAHSQRELARAAFEREERLRQQELSSDRAFETARSNLDAAEAEFQAVHEEIAFSAERELLAADKALTIARSAMHVAERQLHILGLTEEAVALLDDDTDASLLRYEVRSPLDGHVVQRQAVVGESVSEEGALYTVADLSHLWLILDVHERDLVVLRPGLPVHFSPDALRGRRFAGEIEWISSQVDDRTRTVQARVPLANESGFLRANMFGTARIVLHEDDEVVTVPKDAVQTDGCCQLVFVQESDDTFRPRKVALGAAAGAYWEVRGGVDPGEPIVTAGSFLLKTEILKSSIGAGCCEVEPGR